MVILKIELLYFQFARGLIYTLSNYVAVTISLVTVFYVCYYGELITSTVTIFVATSTQSYI